MNPPLLESFSFPLRGRAQDVAFEEQGVRHPATARGWGRTFTPYDEITHVGVSDRLVWIASSRALTVLSRKLFVDPADPERLLRSLLDRVAARPGGLERLARMADIDRRGRQPVPPTVTRITALLCVAVFSLQVFDPRFSSVASFVPSLFGDGDWWRLLTANLLHAFPLHFLVNLIGLLILGRLAERALGHLRTLCVMGASGSLAMAASTFGGPVEVMGVSGVVLGLVGAVLALDTLRRNELPAWWRFPRVLLWIVWVALILEGALGFFVPFIAGEAHVGGFVAGFATTALLTRRSGLWAPEAAWVRNAAALTAALTLVALGAAGAALYAADDYTAEHSERLLRLPGVDANQLNNQAWLIALDPAHTRAQLHVALRLAERAVTETGSEESTILDTLAEVQFQLGRAEEAVLTIDLAIERAPDERYFDYYREQRRRFTGDRAAEDRPADPNLPPAWREEEQPRPTLPPDDGLTV